MDLEQWTYLAVVDGGGEGHGGGRSRGDLGGDAPAVAGRGVADLVARGGVSGDGGGNVGHLAVLDLGGIALDLGDGLLGDGHGDGAAEACVSPTDP